MKKTILTQVFFFLVIHVFGQTGLLYDFNSNVLDPGWQTSASTKLTMTNTNAELKVGISSVGTSYENISFSFSAIDITKNPIVKISIKNATAFNLRMDLADVNGKATNAVVNSKAVAINSAYTVYSFDFTGKFNQSVPNSSVVDASKIAKVVLFFNPGGPNYTGTVYFDDLTIADPIPYFSGSIRVNQVGYELTGPKTAILESTVNALSITTFDLINASNAVVFSGTLTNNGPVAGWKNRFFWTADFSAFKTAGTYRLKIGSKTSYPFDIASSLLFNKTAFSIVDFFKGMRSTLTGDHSLPFNGTRTDKADVYGGWRDAAGDPGKHMSHLSYSNYFSPQQIPFVVWSLLKSYEMNVSSFSAKSTALLAESAWGADYLLRNIDKAGYLYLSVFDDWGAAGSIRQITEWGASGVGNDGVRSPNYQAAMREGAGMAIAALARSSRMKVTGDSTPAQYLRGAIKLYDHLKSPGNGYATKNLEYCNNHVENIIDEYCGLMAAVELYKTTSTAQYLTDASAFADKIMARLNTQGWFRSDDAGKRPFYHAADEGLPLIALSEYMDIDKSKNTTILNTFSASMKWYFQISKEVVNPFSYVREYGAPCSTGVLQTPRKAFFIPHVNETDYWWQGENARIASMSTAFLMLSKKLNSGFNIGADSVSAMAISQLDWILGKNPYDVSMMTGLGVNTYPNYTSGPGNIVGGICNGITADNTDETEIAWMPFATTDWQNWRWIEQWLPHDAWFLLAVSTMETIQKNPAPVASFASPSFVCKGAPLPFSNNSTGTISSYAWDFGVGATPSTSTSAGTQNVSWSSEGSKTVVLTVTGPGGSTSKTVTITVNPLPAQPSIMAMGTSLMSSSAPSYQWTMNGTNITGATGQNYSPTQSNSYAVVVGNTTGCTATSAPYSFIVTGIKGKNDLPTMIYPNPFSIELNCTFTGWGLLKLYDVTGRQLLEQKGNNQMIVDTKELPKGIYFIELKIADKIAYSKMMKE
jgi:PKD repeat protein